MINRIREFFCGISVLISDMALTCLVLALVPMVMRWEFRVALPVWLGILCVQVIFNLILLTVGIPINLYLIFNMAVICGGCYLTLRYSFCIPGWDQMRWFLGTCIAVSGVHGAVIAYYQPGSNQILRYVDILIILSGVYLFTAFQIGQQEISEYMLLACGAMLFDLLAVNQLRTGGEHGDVIYGTGSSGKLLLMGITAGCLLLTGLIVVRGGEEAHTAVEWLFVLLGYVWALCTLIFKVIGVIVGGIILLIIWLLPGTPRVARDKMEMVVQENVEAAVELTEQVIPLWVFQILGIVAGLGALGWILYLCRGKKLQFRKRAVNRRRVVRRSRFLSAIAEALLRLRERFLFELDYRRYRRTPQGLLVLAERVGKQNHLARSVSESPGEYLRRFAGELEQNSGEGKELQELAHMLDCIYYAGQDWELRDEQYRRYEQLLRGHYSCERK